MDSIKSTTPCDDLGAICVWCWCVRGTELLLGCCCHRGAQCVPEHGWVEFTPAWTALDSWPLLLLKKLVRRLWSSPFWSSVGTAVLRRPHMCLCVCVCMGVSHTWGGLENQGGLLGVPSHPFQPLFQDLHPRCFLQVAQGKGSTFPPPVCSPWLLLAERL